MDYYEEVKRLCKINNFSIDAVLRAATDNEIGYSTFWGWKRRNIYPRADIAYKVSKVLGVSVEHFFEDEELIEQAETKQMQLINMFNKLGLTTQKQVLDMVETLTHTK